MTAVAAVGGRFVREHLRQPVVLVLLVALPALFVVLSADVLGEFAKALGGEVAGDAATALGAGWAAGFLSGALAFFQVASARGADRRLALAGLGAGRVAASRLAAAAVLAALVSATAFVTLALTAGIAHPGHAALAIFTFALTYVGIGALVGSVVRDPLQGSLAVAFVFLLDAFSGPGMSDGTGLGSVVPTRDAAQLLIAAGSGTGSAGGEWFGAALTAVVALVLAYGAFWLSARGRS